MKSLQSLKNILLSDVGILIALAVVNLVVHTLTNGQYGFHRDELAMWDDARYLDWGYVAYPPVTPFIARIELVLFGNSLAGFRFFAVVGQSIVIVLAGLIARELGGRRPAQLLAAAAVAVAPSSFVSSTIFQYVGFDYLWWVLIAYLVVRLCKSQDARWWIGIGAVIGVGMMTKYTIAFYIAGIVVGVLLTQNRKYLASPWLWGGVGLALVLFLPNLIWQIQHNFISLEFLSSIHARDVQIGRTQGFLTDQLIVPANPLTIPLWIAGLFYFLISPSARPYRILLWMVIVPFALFLVSQGRGYYTGPIYPILLTGGAVAVEGWLSARSPIQARLARGLAWTLLIFGGIIVSFTGPYAPVNSSWWNISNDLNGDLREEIGWPELAQTVAGIYANLPADEKPQAGILAGNYGEAGAINLYGPALGLPRAISGINSYWWRGYGNPPPQTLVVVGYDANYARSLFEQCELAGHVTNPYSVRNEETRSHPDIFICRKLRQPWDVFWKTFQHFG